MIVLKCDQCEVEHKIKRTAEIPKEAISMRCNYCPNCSYIKKDQYEETFIYPKIKAIKKEEIKIDPDQMNIFDGGA